MTDHPEDYRPTKAEMLASLVSGTAGISGSTSTVQRSHRFHSHILAQIENMAQMGGVPVSVVINELLEVGIEAIQNQLTAEESNKIFRMSQGQRDRPSVQENYDVKGRHFRKTTKSAKQK